MPTHYVEKFYRTAAGPVSGLTTITDDTELNADLVLAASTTDEAIALAITRANLQSVCLFCTADCTVEVNSSSAPTDTISLSAGIPVIAEDATAAAALFPNTASITGFYLTCAEGGTFSFRSLLSQNS